MTTPPLKVPAPRLYCKPGEPYDSAHARWRRRYAAWQDYGVNWYCIHNRSHVARAYYGIELKFVEL